MPMQEVYSTLLNPGNTLMTPGIERMQTMLQYLGNPQFKYKVIHITGSNGKGSTANFIEQGLLHAGFSVGKYTSPHIHTFNESIVYNNQAISNSDLNKVFNHIKYYSDKFQLSLSPFEWLTIIMFYYFAQQNIDYLVLEVGMGGKFDATNVVAPLISIITNISLEHTQWLGTTLESIACHKTGIIKNNYTIIADYSPELITHVQSKTNHWINVLDEYPYTAGLNWNDFTTHIQLHQQEYILNSFGLFQATNFLCAYAALHYLYIPNNVCHYMAQHSKLRGRLDVISQQPLIMVDGAHNLHGIQQLYNSLKSHFAVDDVVLIVSILKDKDIIAMLNILSHLSQTIIYTNIRNNPRSCDTTTLKDLSPDSFKNIHISIDVDDAIKIAKGLNKKLILITGSLYLLEQVYIDAHTK